MDTKNVLLFAQPQKKEMWKNFFDKETKGYINWIDRTAGDYCVIAIKGHIEKKGETIRELEDEHGRDVFWRAKQVFLFAVKIGTSYADFEAIPEKQNWCYSVIETSLFGEEPVDSIHNKDVLHEFKKKFLPPTYLSYTMQDESLGTNEQDTAYFHDRSTAMPRDSGQVKEGHTVGNGDRQPPNIPEQFPHDNAGTLSELPNPDITNLKGMHKENETLGLQSLPAPKEQETAADLKGMHKENETLGLQSIPAPKEQETAADLKGLHKETLGSQSLPAPKEQETAADIVFRSLGYLTENWDRNKEDELLKKIQLTVPKELEHFRILFIGHRGSGKSTLINALNTVVKGAEDKRATEGHCDHSTAHFSEYYVYTKSEVKIAYSFCEVKETDYDILKEIVEEKTDPNKPKDKSICLIAYVFKACDYNNKERIEWLIKILSVQTSIPRIVILTHLDNVDQNQLRSIEATADNPRVKDAINTIIDESCMPPKHIFPVTYSNSYQHLNPDNQQMIHLLSILRRFADTVKQIYKQMVFNESRSMSE